MTKPISHPPFHTLVELLRFRAEERPDFPTYTFLADGEKEEISITLSELDRQARRIAALLQKIEKKGTRALLLYSPGLDYISAFFGCLYAGIVAVPAYPPDPHRLSRTLPRLQSIIKDSEASVVLTTQAIHTLAEFIFSQAPDLAALKWVATDSLQGELEKDWREASAEESTLAFLQYTSGSTGSPKGVMLSHGNLLHNSSHIYRCFEHHSESQGVIWLPPYHDMGLIGGILQPLYGAFPVTLLSPLAFLQRPYRWLKAVSKYRATTSGGPNFAYDLCVRKITPEQRQDLDLSRWDLAFTGAEPVRSETLDRFAEAFGPCGFKREAFYPCYGLAEATLIVSGGRKGSPPKVKRLVRIPLRQGQIVAAAAQKSSPPEDVQSWVGCGPSLSDQEIVIVDPDTLRPCLPQKVGEVWVKGFSVAQGYWKRPEDTQINFQASFSDSGKGSYLRTGDLGFLDGGDLYITGRLKDLIIIHGQNHYPQDIEQTLEKTHSLLRPGCGAVFSVPREEAEQLVVVYEVDLSPDSSNPEGDFNPIAVSIRQAVAQNHELETSTILFLKKGTVPKTSSGKISRFACREAFLKGTLENLFEWRRKQEKIIKLSDELKRLETHPKTPSGTRKGSEEIRSWLTLRIAEQGGLSVKDVDVLKPLSAYGLDSKDAINLMGELEEWLGRSFSPSLLWKYPTIQAFSDFLAGEGPDLKTSS